MTIRHEKARKDIYTLENCRTTPFIYELRTAFPVSGPVFAASVKQLIKQTKDLSSSLFKVSVKDIDKALLKLSEKYTKSDEELRRITPYEYHDLLLLWKPKKAAKLPPHRHGVDHQIKIKKYENGSEMKIPFGPLYYMSREELLVLRKTLNDLLDKGYSNLPVKYVS